MISMKKKFAALAVASVFSGAAVAQSNVTVYGVADVGYVNSSGDRAANGTKNANYSGIDSGLLGGSRLGFKGEESLGNGLMAVFLLEYALSPDSNTGIGTGTSANRQSYVGLSSRNLGALTLGRQYAPGYYASGRNNPFGGSGPHAPLNILTAAGVNTITANAAGRISNSINYASPTWNGFSANAIYGFGENGGTAADGVSQGSNGLYGAGLNYANGPLNLDAVYHQRTKVSSNPIVTTPTATLGGRKDIGEWAVMGSYDFKVVKIFGSYQNEDDDNGGAAREGSNNIWSAGVNVPVFGNGSIQAAYSKLNWDRRGAGSSDVWALGYRHALSKRTTLYTTYAIVDNDKDALVAAGPVANTRVIGETNSTFTAGINHSF